MEFGKIATEEAEGTVLAHSHRVPGGRVRKGRILTADDIAVLRDAGLSEVIVARLGPDDLIEDAAAAQVAQALVPDPAAVGLRMTEASTGRVNFYATRPGLADLDVQALHRMNRADPMITVATLPPYARVAAGTMVATVKIISYAVSRAAVASAVTCGPAIGIAPVALRTATLIITDMGEGPGKGEAAIATRLDRLGMELTETRVVAHDEGAIATALTAIDTDLALILTASATSDPHDVGPQGLVEAGGTLTRFGMPVDPGNLLFYGRLGPRSVIGLPGCARSPALNGADWVLERICCGLEPDDDDIAAMGVGGLLKESPARPHPRAG